MKTKPFTIEGCKANNNRAVTRRGDEAIIYHYEHDSEYPLTGRILGKTSADSWTKDGVCFIGAKSNEDLFLPHTPKLRPWTPEEAIGKVVKSRNGSDIFMITSVIDGSFCGKNLMASPELVLAECTQLDGSPCGVEE
jgi:hypothetical protein